jgi:hypothetical protein
MVAACRGAASYLRGHQSRYSRIVLLISNPDLCLRISLYGDCSFAHLIGTTAINGVGYSDTGPVDKSHPSALLGTALVGFWWIVITWRAKRINHLPNYNLLGALVSNVLYLAGFQSYVKFADEVFGDHPSRSNIYEWSSPFHPLITSQHLAWWFYGALVPFAAALGLQFLHIGKIRFTIPLVPISIILCLMSTGSARHAPLFYFSVAGVLICTTEYLLIASLLKLTSMDASNTRVYASSLQSLSLVNPSES